MNVETKDDNIEYPIVLQLTKINAEHLIEYINMAGHEGVHHDDVEELRDYLEKKSEEL